MARHKSELRAKRHFLLFFFSGNFPPSLKCVGISFLSAHPHLAWSGQFREIKKNSKNSEQRFYDGFPIGSKVDMCSGEVIGHLCEDDYHGSVYFFERRGENGNKKFEKILRTISLLFELISRSPLKNCN